MALRDIKEVKRDELKKFLQFLMEVIGYRSLK